MIDSTITFFRETLQQELSNFPFDLVVDNIACKENERILQKVVITIINIEEQTVLQNLLPAHDRVDHLLPLNLNLSVLLTSNYPNDYQYSLKALDAILRFFNKNQLFTPHSEKKHFLQFSVELVALNFEELNKVWTTLGASYLPSLVYKIKMTESIGDS